MDIDVCEQIFLAATVERFRAFFIGREAKQQLTATAHDLVLVHGIVGVFSFLLPAHQRRPLENREMVGGGRLRDPGMPGDLAHGAAFTTAMSQDALSRRIAHGLAESGCFFLVHAANI